MADRRQSTDPLERYYSRPEFAAPLVEWFLRVVRRDLPCEATDRDRVDDLLAGGRLALEPCVGHGGLVHGLATLRSRWVTVDLDPDARASQWHGDFLESPITWRWRRKAMSGRGGNEAISLVVTNPPFSRAIEVVETAWKRHPEAVVAILQRQTWYEPTAARRQFFIDHPPDVITIGRCSFLDGDGQPVRGKNGAQGGDHASYAWFVWGLERVGLAGGMARIIPWRGE